MKPRRLIASNLTALAWLACLLAAAPRACCQERDARRIVVATAANWEATLESDQRLSNWREQGDLVELARQFDAGKTADPSAVRRVLDELPQALPASTPVVQQLRIAAEEWMRHLETTNTTDANALLVWDPHEEDQVTAERQRFDAQLRAEFEAFGRWLQTGADGGAGWRRNLLWDQSRKLVSGQPLTEDELDAIEVRWTIAQVHWNTFSFRQKAQSIARAVVLRRRALPDAQAAVRLAVSTLLAAQTADAEPVGSDSQSAIELESAIALLDRLDVGSGLTIGHHRARVHPHGQLRIGVSGLLGARQRNVDETFGVNDVFAGAWARGTGRLQGTVDVQRVERHHWPSWDLSFVGESVSSTTSNSEGASVGANARSTIRGSKRIEWRPVGLIGLPARAAASANVSYSSIAIGGGSRRQGVARSEVYGRRPTAEYETAQAVRRSCIQRLDQDSELLVRPFNQLYDRAFIKPIHRQGEFAPRIATSGQAGDALWSCWYAPVEGLGVASAPAHAAHHDWSLLLHEDMVARHLEAQFPTRLVSVQELADQIRSWTSSATSSTTVSPSPDEPAESAYSPVMMWRSRNPLAVQFREGSMALQLHLDELRTSQGNIAQSAIEVVYECSIDEGGLLLRRNSSPVVRLGDAASPSSGRQQTLKRLLTRQFARSLPEQITVRPDRWLVDPSTEADLRLECKELQVGGGWIQLAGSCPAP